MINDDTFNSYQYGPDTYLLQLRDTNFPVRLREYVKVANRRSPAFALNENSVDYSVSVFLVMSHELQSLTTETLSVSPASNYKGTSSFHRHYG